MVPLTAEVVNQGEQFVHRAPYGEGSVGAQNTAMSTAATMLPGEQILSLRVGAGVERPKASSWRVTIV